MGRRAVAGACTVVAATSAVLLVPGVASAKPVYHDNQRFTSEPQLLEFCGVPATAVFSGHSNNSARLVRGSDGQAFLAHDTFQVTETWTTAAGSITVRHHGNFREQTAERVPGPVTYSYVDDSGALVTTTSDDVWRFTFRDSGFFRVYGADGRLLAKATGTFRAQEDFDTLGDSEPGGRPVPGTFVVLRDQTGRSFTEEELCDAVVPELT